MKNKFNPNYHLVATLFCDIVIHDFTGKSHTVPEDYLAALGKDTQVLQYINPESSVAKGIKHEMQNIVIAQKNPRAHIKL